MTFRFLYHFAVSLCRLSSHLLGKSSPHGFQFRGNWSNETPRTWQPGQLKEHTGFLVSRNLTVPAAPPSAGGVILMMIFPVPRKKMAANLFHPKPKWKNCSLVLFSPSHHFLRDIALSTTRFCLKFSRPPPRFLPLQVLWKNNCTVNL